ncbi:hypothetical protein RN001_008455 [Aquatica leii]|uniref:Ubiquitin-like-conjugating enzyme ATG10 n=1 Tax=Aquatica leii TaxID=1421715 RepID=A0AAN7PXD7_9COLE|nr:hypothetical protein RN001_008455 [Aquatica leii]
MDDSLRFAMSWDAFLKCIDELKSFSDELNDEWVLHKLHDGENGAYLTKKVRRQTFSQIDGGLISFEENLLVDESVPVNGDVTTHEYHVVYSSSYACPVLCLNIWRSNGSLLTIEECWVKFSFSSDDKYNTLTQMEHPVLMKPFITLHPCKTAELIGTFGNSKNIVVSWLSTVGPVIGLNMLTDYARLTY